MRGRSFKLLRLALNQHGVQSFDTDTGFFERRNALQRGIETKAAYGVRVTTDRYMFPPIVILNLYIFAHEQRHAEEKMPRKMWSNPSFGLKQCPS